MREYRPLKSASNCCTMPNWRYKAKNWRCRAANVSDESPAYMDFGARPCERVGNARLQVAIVTVKEYVYGAIKTAVTLRLGHT